mmetsp:Transcript_60843/g.144843  ORF Transcript_60843/g.144843 Transcript_60843/m.144843 type:complete len:222 (+) Transcript_60843:572-1237(+)
MPERLFMNVLIHAINAHMVVRELGVVVCREALVRVHEAPRVVDEVHRDALEVHLVREEPRLGDVELVDAVGHVVSLARARSRHFVHVPVPFPNRPVDVFHEAERLGGLQGGGCRHAHHHHRLVFRGFMQRLFVHVRFQRLQPDLFREVRGESRARLEPPPHQHRRTLRPDIRVIPRRDALPAFQHLLLELVALREDVNPLASDRPAAAVVAYLVLDERRCV